MKSRITISLSEEVLKKVDDARGIVHRSTYLDELLKTINMPSLPAKITEGMTSSPAKECAST